MNAVMSSLGRCAPSQRVAIALAFAVRAHAQANPSIEITLQPTRNSTGNVDAVNVTMLLTDTARTASPLSLRAPIVLNNIPGIADRMERFVVDDRNGSVALTTADDPVDVSARGQYRHWRASRPVVSPVTIRYRAIVPPGRIRPGPPYDLRTWAGGVSGGGSGVLALPEDTRRFNIRFTWDVAQLAPGSIGVSSLGEGEAQAVGPLNMLTSSWIMAGPVGRFPERPSPGFNAYWLGRSSSLNPEEDMRWAASTYGSLGRFFGDTVVRPYRFFLRVLPESTTSGGTAGNRSFMLQLPVSPARSATNASAFGVRNTIAHEMIHGWAGGFAGAGQWASEGLTTYLTARTLLRLGLQPVEAFVNEVNRLARQYYANPYRNATTEVAAAAFWADRNGEVLPYVRGALYFFDVNAKIRAASRGTRSVDDVLLELFARRSRGETISVDTWKAALAKEIGPSAAGDVDAIVVRGVKTLTLAPDAFGSCFERKTVNTVLPDFAFDRRTPGVQTVVSLVPGSAAAVAGLRDGDVITTPMMPEFLSSPEPRAMRLDIQRDGAGSTISYTTRPKVLESYEWSRVSGVPDDVCRRG
jgi:hypothetical protein